MAVEALTIEEQEDIIEEARVAELNRLRMEYSMLEEDEEGKKKKQRINAVTAGFMITVALLYDGVQFALVWIGIGFLVNWLISVCAWLTFFFWFKSKGVSYAKPKNVLTAGVALLLEIIPVLNALPALTLSVLALIVITKSEDTLLAKIGVNIPMVEKLSGNMLKK